MNFPNGLGGGWGQSAGNRGFREIQPVCKPGPDFDTCAREQLIGSTGVVLAIVLFVGLSGFVVWFWSRISGLPLVTGSVPGAIAKAVEPGVGSACV
ncbi:MAG: hypothetical protein CM15mP116_11270 [Synechococcus sp.]|nr:MAG: hypothetical protein CM15mP116_11270 [Synechococcus sp.]